ncbi:MULTISPECIES: helix-turn-helix transcriptional regulator [Streptomyces]|uniref:Helix-turn-helix transcriptional regulator n=1 Tax=Streptomyces sp. 900129855 TaxID=3155129 RepID=A0ABV2ZJ30_9ACTN
MPHPTRASTGGIGTRIQKVAALRGYSLRELGRRANVSPAMLSRIINGQRQASPSIVSAVARALSVSISVLHGQPYIHQLQADQLDRLITPISMALDDWDIPLGEGDPPPRPLDDLRAAVTELERKRAKAEYIGIAHELPSLLAEVNAHVLTQSPGHTLEQAAWLQAELCRTVYVVGRQIGFMDLARLALSRMGVAAPQSGDPRQVAIERWDRAQLMADAARHDRGILLVQQALKDLDDDGQQTTKAVRGALHLKAAILSSRRGDTAGADEWLTAAGEIAEETGETRDYGLVFGPVNVVIHAMSASSDRDKHARALEKARKVRLPDDYPEARAGHYWVDRARAETWTARHEDAFKSLGQARKAAPQQTRYHPGVHETVATLLRARTRAPGDLLEFANWCGV